MRVILMLVVSMFFLTLFPLPAFAAGEPNKGDAGTVSVDEEELAPLPKPTPLVPAAKPSAAIDDELAPLVPLTPLPPKKAEPKKSPVAKPADPKPKKDPVVDVPIAPLTPLPSDKPKVEPKKDPPALVIKPPREFQAPPPDVVTKVPPSHAMRYIGIGSGIVGVAVIGVGAYFGVDVMNDKAKAQKTTSLEEFNSLKEDARGKIQTADILYGVGGGLLATGVVLFVVDTAMNNSATPAKSVSIAVSPNGGVSIAGTW